MDLDRWLLAAREGYDAWLAEYPAFTTHPATEVSDDAFAGPFAELTARLRNNYPFGHPSYAGQMLKPPHPVALVGYVAAMQVNPNNHALDGGPATAQMEKEVVQAIAAMVGFDAASLGGPPVLGHLTSSGTIANLEALYVARESHPGRAIAYSAEAHYTHARMCRVLGVRGVPVATDAAGRLDVEVLEQLLAANDIGTVVCTLGTTGLGAVDPLDRVLEVAARYGARVHVDAAYGGFFRLIADDTADGVASAPWLAMAHADSIVIDPHKHGLQPYGCGAVLFRDPSVGQFYDHDSPYTYFTSDELHLGEISLECSRAGAAAAALWLTLQVFPLTSEGLGAVLRPGRRAALRWAALIAESPALDLFQPPELDIVTYLPRVASGLLSDVDAASGSALTRGMTDPIDPVFLATYSVTAEALARRGHDLTADVAQGRILRSVLLKPEADSTVDALHARVTALVTQES